MAEGCDITPETVTTCSLREPNFAFQGGNVGLKRDDLALCAAGGAPPAGIRPQRHTARPTFLQVTAARNSESVHLGHRHRLVEVAEFAPRALVHARRPKSRNHRSWPEPPDRRPSPAAWNSGLCDDDQPAGAGSRKPQKCRTRTPACGTPQGQQMLAQAQPPTDMSRKRATGANSAEPAGRRNRASDIGPTRNERNASPVNTALAASGGWRQRTNNAQR